VVTLGLPPEQAAQFWLWVGRLWPLLATLVTLFALRTKIRQPFAFLVFGYLMCLGVHTAVGNFTWSLPTPLTGEVPDAEKLFRSMLVNSAGTSVVSLFVSVPFLLWFSRLFLSRPKE
jgi:hypothetical protein